MDSSPQSRSLSLHNLSKMASAVFLYKALGTLNALAKDASSLWAESTADGQQKTWDSCL